jgi:hypothetical protein
MESDAQAEDALSINPAMWPRRKMLLETLRLALKEKAPKTYRELWESGELQNFLEGRADVISEAADFAATNAPRPPETDWLEAVRSLDMMRNTAWKIALEEGIMDLPYDEREEDAEEEY